MGTGKPIDARAYQEHVASGLDGQARSALDAELIRHGFHLEVVAHHEPLEAELAAQQIGHDFARQGSGQLPRDRLVHHMGRHDGVELATRLAKRRQLHGVEPRGHAIEVRLCAEDPFRGFAPSPGKIEWLRLPQGPGVRCDAGVFGGSEVSIYYDPMIAKLIVWGRDRAEAMRRLGRALAELRVEGIRTNVPLFEALLADDDFRAARFDIQYDYSVYRGGSHRPVSGVNAYVNVGVYSLSDLRELVVAIPGYDNGSRIPIDLTFDLGFRINTDIGTFDLAFANFLGFLSP